MMTPLPVPLQAAIFETLLLLAQGGADQVTVESLKGSGLNTLDLDLGNNSTDKVTIKGTGSADQFTVSDGSVKTAAQWDGSSVINVNVIDSVRSQGDTLTVDAGDGNDTIDASQLNSDLLTLKLIGGAGNDRIIGSRYNDVIDSGQGNDRVTGGPGLDTFFDASPAGEIDTLVENSNDDMGLFNNTLIIGTLLDRNGSKNFEIDKTSGNELTDAGDRWASGATVEDLKDLFERAELTGDTGNNTIVVNDLDNVIKVGSQTRNVTSWRGKAWLDNGASDTGYLEHYLITFRLGDTTQVHIADSAGSSDRLVVTGSSASDWLTLSADNAVVYDAPSGPGWLTPDTSGLFERVQVSSDRYSNIARITFGGVNFVEINSREGDDRLAIQAVSESTMLNLAAGSDIVNIGSNAGIESATRFGAGTLNAINALLTINGQGDNDFDVVTLDDTGDPENNYGTLTENTITNNIAGTTGLTLMGAGGSITYGTLESLNINLGSAATGNVFSIESTHGSGSVTTLTSGNGDDVINVEKISGGTSIETGGGSDIVRVGSTTAMSVSSSVSLTRSTVL